MRWHCILGSLLVLMSWSSGLHAEVVCPDGPENVEGIDVSYWQGDIDWQQVRDAGYQFAFIRVSDGVSVVDNRFDANWMAAADAGVLRGAYQFFRPSVDPIAQAELLLQKLDLLSPLDLPPVIDVETADGMPPEEVAARLQIWLEYVQDATGRKPIIYTGKFIWEALVKSNDFSNYPLWIAQYGPECPNLPANWQSWKFFQYTSQGTVPGITGKVDLNRFNGDRQALLSWLLDEPYCGDGECNGLETPQNCPNDCPYCAPIPQNGGIVDDAEVCFIRNGEGTLWFEALEGWEGSSSYTYATSESSPINYGVWSFDFEVPGRYALELYIPPSAESKMAQYRLRHAGQESRLELDQSLVQGWVLMGEFDFALGEEQSLRLDDNTGEPYSERVVLAFDAVRLTLLSIDPEFEPDVIEILDDNPDPDVIDDPIDQEDFDPPVEVIEDDVDWNWPDPNPDPDINWPDMTWPDSSGDFQRPDRERDDDGFFDCGCRSTGRARELPWGLSLVTVLAGLLVWRWKRAG
ncbi:MAG: GH25 family lysozyme [Myxococcota bacterium]|jgi:lysozyme|nr:GH25 family lysozyme [Myxococcota bacterium]